jgi:hypothetical protein
MEQDQARVVEFLSRPESYPEAPERVETAETHISRVFIAGAYAFKLKKALNLGFLDYSTLDLRRRFCEEEIRLNRRLAPQVYLDVVWVREVGGSFRLALGGDDRGREVEPLVRMRRVPAESLLSALVLRGEATRAHIDCLVDLLIPFYRAARPQEVGGRLGTPEALRQTLRQNFELARPFVGELLAPEVFHALRSAQFTYLTFHEDLFRKRLRDGRVRDGHGDLRAEHVAYLPECAVLDAIDFNEALRVTDTACDVAFLKMDLEILKAPELGRYFIDRYVSATGDEEARLLLDFYVSYRAFVRGNVDGLKLSQSSVAPKHAADLRLRAKRFFELAHAHALSFHRPLLVLVGGLSGTGKSTLAQGIAERLAAPAFRSDEVRKELAGLAPSEAAKTSLPESFYTEAWTQRTYEELLRRAQRLLLRGAVVVLDATFPRRDLREAARRVGRDSGARVVHIECTAPAAVAAERMALRAAQGASISDATAVLQAEQAAAYQPCAPGESVRLETTAPPEELIAAALSELARRAG